MPHNIKILDPVEGFISYVNDIKPYHTKIIESLVEYVSNDNINITILEDFGFEIELIFDGRDSIIGCLTGGYGTLPFGDPDTITILSPDLSKTMTEFPAINANSFIVLGDKTLVFDPSAGLTLNIKSYIEDKIIAVTESTGSPPTGGSFTLSGDRTSEHSEGDIITVSGSFDNDTSYKIKGSTGSPANGVILNGSPITTTTLEVSNQIVKSNSVTGFIKTLASSNNGFVTSVSATYVPGINNIIEHTIVKISGSILSAPVVADDNQKYVSSISTGALEYTKVLSYSNILKFYNPANSSLLQRPDEGIIFAEIQDLSQGNPSYFEINGNFESSNVFVGDEFFIIGSTDNDNNNNPYTIESITTSLAGSPAILTTRLGVASIHDSSVDGYIKLQIPSNVFIIDDDYTDFFVQGNKIKAAGGNKNGIYTVLNSIFANGETQIRVEEDLIHSSAGRLIISSQTNSTGSPLTENSFIVDGNAENIYQIGSQFNVVDSLRNDGLYTISSGTGSPSGIVYDNITNSTYIPVIEDVEVDTNSGEIHKFVKGTLTNFTTGFGETPALCQVVPETFISVEIKENLLFNNIAIATRDDIISIGKNINDWGYDLPASTVLISGGSPLIQPDIPIQSIAPSSPTIGDFWFDISLNTGSPSAPGILKQFREVQGSPAIIWVEVLNNKAYWIDTDTNYMYYRLIYQYYNAHGSPAEYPLPTITNSLDTGWILEYTTIPGFDYITVGNPAREQIGFQTFFVTANVEGKAESIFEFTGSPALSIPTILTGSPPAATPNPEMLEVTLNGTITMVNILSSTSFDIIAPRVRVGDFIEAKVFDTTAIPSGIFVGLFDANPSISETFDMILGYKFHINGTDSGTNTIHIPDNANGDVYTIFSTGSPPDISIEIKGTEGSPNNNGIYTITNVSQSSGSPITEVILTVTESLLDTGIFSNSPVIEAGKALYQQWYQYIIVNTTSNSITVYGDATTDISDTDSIQLVHSSIINNNGVYTVDAPPTYDGRNTTISVLETINTSGNTGGWVEST